MTANLIQTNYIESPGGSNDYMNKLAVSTSEKMSDPLSTPDHK